MINTLRSWGVRIDESYFLGGIDKAEVLKVIRPHIMFDDKIENLVEAQLAVPSAHVPYAGVQAELFSRAAVTAPVTISPIIGVGDPSGPIGRQSPAAPYVADKREGAEVLKRTTRAEIVDSIVANLVGNSKPADSADLDENPPIPPAPNQGEVRATSSRGHGPANRTRIAPESGRKPA